MRPSLVSFLALLALFFASCAAEGPTTEEVGDQFERGLTGQGQLGPIDRSDDPYVRPRGGSPDNP